MCFSCFTPVSHLCTSRFLHVVCAGWPRETSWRISIRTCFFPVAIWKQCTYLAGDTAWGYGTVACVCSRRAKVHACRCVSASLAMTNASPHAHVTTES